MIVYVHVHMIHDLYYGSVFADWLDCGFNRTTKVWSGPIAEVEKLEGIIPIHEIPALGDIRVNMDIITMAKMIQKLDFGDVAPYTRSANPVLAIAEWITSNHQMVVPHANIRAVLAGMGMILREQVIGWITPADIPIIAERVLMHHLRTLPL